MLILAKNRNGPTDDIHLKIIDHAMRFVQAEAPRPDDEDGGAEG
jgi:replicative DNA helicase